MSADFVVPRVRALRAIRCQLCSEPHVSAEVDAPCPLGCPEDELPTCHECGDAVPVGEGCDHLERYCASCFVERCSECRSDLRDALADASRGE